MAKLVWLWVLILGLGCTNIVLEDGDMGNPGDGKILDKAGNRSVLLGDTKVLSPKIAPAGTVQMFVQEFGWEQVSAKNMSNPEMVTVCGEAFPADNVGEAQQSLWQVVFSYNTGNALSGAGDESNQNAILGGTVKDENIVDLGFGTCFSIPLASFVPKIRLTAIRVGGSPFAGVVKCAFDHRVSLLYGYQPKTNVRTPTMTQVYGTVAPLGAIGPDPLPNNGKVVFRRPKYANAIHFTWQPHLTATPIIARFLGDTGVLEIVAYTITNVTPPPVIPWPEGASYVIFENTTGVNVNLVTAVNYLAL